MEARRPKMETCKVSVGQWSQIRIILKRSRIRTRIEVRNGSGSLLKWYGSETLLCQPRDFFPNRTIRVMLFWPYLLVKWSCGVGKGEVIKGWDLGVATMTRGERALFFIRHLFYICMISWNQGFVLLLYRYLFIDGRIRIRELKFLSG